MIWVNNTIPLFLVILFGIGNLRGNVGELIKAEIITTKVPTPPNKHKIEGKSSRSLLMVKQEERGKTFDAPSFTSYHIYDPGLPEKRLVRIFRGPENDQDLGVLTPHYDGWALSRIHLDREQDPEGESKWAWYHYPKGIVGPEVTEQFWIRESKGEYIFGQEDNSKQDSGSAIKLVRYQPQLGKMEKTKLIFSHTQWISSTEILGISDIGNGERMVLFDIERFEYRELGPPPPDYETDRPYFIRLRLALAGKDGVFMSTWKGEGFALSFIPTGGKWIEVISGVNIRKTFGGVAPWLPVEYLGNGNFAISKTTIDSVPVPEDWPEDQKMFGAAQGVTMMIAAKSGKTLKKSEPFVYEHNPPLKIPTDWWQDGFKPKLPFWEQQPEEAPTLFKREKEIRELSFGKDSKLALNEEEDYRESEDGRHAVIYREWTQKTKNKKAGQTLSIIDGKNGKIQKIEIASEFAEVLTEAYWINSAAP